MSLVILLTGICLFYFLGFRVWSKYISNKILEVDATESTPAHDPSLRDNVDFIPVKSSILWGHHYASIAGAAPIIGPAVAIIWGWLPAFLWVVLGTVFIGAVHDFAALVLSTRHSGKTIGAISAELIHPRVQVLFQLIIYFLIWLVLVVFAFAISILFSHYPESVIPINFEIIIALVLGILFYKFKVKTLIPSILALLLLYFFIWVGAQYPIVLQDLTQIQWIQQNPITSWSLILLTYAAIASILPVWLLLQPRDYINSHQLIVGLTILIVGLIIVHPDMSAPMINLKVEDAPPLFPFIFVTIACGAISGFHGLVASSTTSKQLNKIQDARIIGYGGMLGEGLLALIATLAVAAGLSDWHSHYHNWNSSGIVAISNFVKGASTFMEPYPLSKTLATTFISVMVISFAATSLDTAARIQRMIVSELGARLNIKFLQNRIIAMLFAIGPTIPLVILGKDSWAPLWLLFGTTNQLIGGITLLTIVLYLVKNQRPLMAFLIPMLIVLSITTLSMTQNLVQWGQAYFANDPNIHWLTLIVGFCILMLELWVIFEAGLVCLKSIKIRKEVVHES